MGIQPTSKMVKNLGIHQWGKFLGFLLCLNGKLNYLPGYCAIVPGLQAILHELAPPFCLIFVEIG